MKYLIAAAIIASSLAFVPSNASAGERVNDMVMGGLSGLVVAGPVGMVAGGVIGYTAGPNISHGMGLHRHQRAQRRASNAPAPDRQYYR